MLQMKVANINAGKPIWVSPLRDIAHCTPALLTEAFNIALRLLKDPSSDNYLVTLDQSKIELVLREIRPVYEAYQRLLDSISEKSNANKSVGVLIQESGIDNCSLETRLYLSKCIARTFLCYYLCGVREAMHPEAPAMLLDEFMRQAEQIFHQITEVAQKRSRLWERINLWARTVKKHLQQLMKKNSKN